ncbi:MAG: hypothetical protein F7C36_01580 [Desulfurococcales archaeon]|nr:hypothetical protein [Desulfurococcales archaeon]
MTIIPMYGQGFFHISYNTIYYTIVFDYYDKDGDYAKILMDPRSRREEEKEIKKNMQRLMDEERIVINGRDVRAIVDSALLEPRGHRRLHSVVFHVRMDYTPIEGVNVYENFYEPDTAEYDYTVYWIAPPGGEILTIESEGRVYYQANKRIAVIRVSKGTRLSGYEAVSFRLGSLSYH